MIKITYNTNFVCLLLGQLSWGQQAFYSINRQFSSYFDSFESVLMDIFENSSGFRDCVISLFKSSRIGS